mmetsp:Transcript_57354/g.95309  ORF Transcript_57354/g.95309 Transcript_57354/m.95309 type:complete len:255 (-) Transcript_57354:862-1626(-)
MDPVGHRLQRIHRRMCRRTQMQLVVGVEVLVRQKDGPISIQSQLRRNFRRFCAGQSNRFTLVQLDIIRVFNHPNTTTLTQYTHTLNPGQLQRLLLRRRVGIAFRVHLQRHGGVQVRALEVGIDGKHTLGGIVRASCPASQTVPCDTGHACTPSAADHKRNRTQSIAAGFELKDVCAADHALLHRVHDIVGNCDERVLCILCTNTIILAIGFESRLFFCRVYHVDVQPTNLKLVGSQGQNQLNLGTTIIIRSFIR